MDTVNFAYPRARAALDLLERELALLPTLPSAPDQALSALARFLSTDALAADHLAALEAAIKNLGEAQIELSPGRPQETLRRAAELLLGCRDEAIENTIRHQAQMLRAAPTSASDTHAELTTCAAALSVSSPRRVNGAVAIRDSENAVALVNIPASR